MVFYNNKKNIYAISPPPVDELFDGLSGKKNLGHFKKNIVQRNVAEKKILASNWGMKKNSCTEKLPNPPLLASFDLKQYISGSTHASGHTLDLIITRSEENIVNHYNIFDPLISDHSVVHLQLLIRKPKFVKKHLLLRNLRAVNIHKFKTDVLNSFLLKNLRLWIWYHW